jgi:(aminoalkyl)phosphonate N-acetyltransferase
METQIRTATEEDVQALYKIICKLEDCSFNPALFKAIYAENLNNNNIHYLVAVNKDNTVVGFISAHVQALLHHCGKVAEIQEMFVEEAYRNFKVGTALLAEMEKHLKSSSCYAMEVSSNIKRSEAHSFYLRSGFVETHKKFVKELN